VIAHNTEQHCGFVSALLLEESHINPREVIYPHFGNHCSKVTSETIAAHFVNLVERILSVRICFTLIIQPVFAFAQHDAVQTSNLRHCPFWSTSRTALDRSQRREQHALFRHRRLPREKSRPAARTRTSDAASCTSSAANASASRDSTHSSSACTSWSFTGSWTGSWRTSRRPRTKWRRSLVSWTHPWD